MKNLFLITITFTMLIACSRIVDNPAAKATDRLDKEWWKERHQKVLENNKKKDPKLILIGNSILNFLDSPDRTAVWEKYLDKYNTVNMGFSGDRTENVIWRLQNGEIDDISPKVALLLIGTNNTDGNHFLSITPPNELAAAIWKITRIIRNKLPDTQILILGIFPYGYKPNLRNNIIKETNEIISDFPAKDDYIHYMDIGNIFTDENNNVKKSLMPDYLHPNAEGHLLMFGAIEQKIDELMK